MPEATKTLVH